MASAIASQWRALWHTLTSDDRHASHDSPYRTGQHVPLSQSKHNPLASVSTTALESRADLTSYDHDLESGRGFTSPSGRSSPKFPYTRSGPGSLQRQGSGLDARMEAVDAGEIQMQSFDDGLPPPPPVAHSWKRIDRWLEDNYEELFENMCEPATFNDVNELEHELDCSLPQEVRDSLQIHDGQERGGRPSGAVFGCMLLDCEEIIQEWQNWRTVNEAYLSNDRNYEIPQMPTKAFASSSSSSTIPVAQSSQNGNSQWRQELLDKQESQPPNAVQKVYAHPAWIPLARDWGGNNIAVDLAPGPAGKWGQVILMGRDYDCKYVISRSWSAFLATLADDMGSGKWFIEDETGELKLREFKQPGVEPAYIDILRWRADQKYGRPKKRSLRINSQIAGQSNGYSPYGSPTTSDDRGRSPQRFPNGKGPAASSPRAHISSPLARVTEEGPQPLTINTDINPPSNIKAEQNLMSVDSPRSERLMSLDSPVRQSVSEEQDKRSSMPKSRLNNVESHDAEETQHFTSSIDHDDANGGAEEMKNVEF